MWITVGTSNSRLIKTFFVVQIHQCDRKILVGGKHVTFLFFSKYKETLSKISIVLYGP